MRAVFVAGDKGGCGKTSAEALSLMTQKAGKSSTDRREPTPRQTPPATADSNLKGVEKR